MDTNKTLMLPGAKSTIAGDVDSLFNFILYTTGAIFILVVVVMMYFAIRYRQRSGKAEVTSGRDYNHVLEVIWTVIPSILVMIVFFWGFKVYMKMNIIPRDAIEIKVTGQKWFWTFDYDEGINIVNELVIPVDTPVKLLMSSQDVIHSFFVPSFRTKMDVLPNRYSLLWFESTEVGEYDLFCTEYCGKGHSEMIGKVRVLPKTEYEKWLVESAVEDTITPLAELGEQLFKKKACFTCHSIDGSRLVGPSFKGIFGNPVKHNDGTTATVDENYIRESLLDPQAKVVDGFAPVMPTYQGQLTDREIDGIAAFIKTLK